ncbi:ABC transporter ATP-binding protein [Neobittarella massiliensis]|uniref:ABC transporter ATP-binding protein n=2 Tax=Neobittarella massiliensis (ex Bilen et al. 2018) TaxID=2041842 RepID=A0A8J6IK89_9FIRM|nr:ABC transporter ATP-binding protein [Neobittarella massiliensis]MBC3515099.1 ABC transporter ATP-binding protein [Neobittarella massiliensis]
MSILQMEQVSYQYAGSKKKVLKKINMAFEPGKLYVVVGRSGAGKSTLLALLSGLDLCTEGSMYYEGQDMKVLDRDAYRAKGIGVIFQGYNLLTNATALENIVLSMNISGSREKDKREYALRLLEKVGIDRDTAMRKVLKLSGGEQQRVGIARAIAHEPAIIIADEPTGNLDGDTEKNIMEILRSLAHDQGKCVIVVTHSKAVSKYADELWGLNAGNLVFLK